MLKRRISISGIVLLSLLLICSNAFAGWKTATTEEVKALVAQKPEQGGYMLVDSRPEIKFFASHLPWAVSIPWQDMKNMLDELPTDKNKKRKKSF